MGLRAAIISGTVLVLSSWVFPSSLVAAPKTWSANAAFQTNPTGTRETIVEIDVEEGKNETVVNLLYSVQSTSPEGDFLFYHYITGGGPVSSQDFNVLPGGKVAILDTVIPAYDDEGGIEFEMGVTVIWLGSGSNRKGTRQAVALVFFDYPFESQYFTNFLFPSEEATISRTK